MPASPMPSHPALTEVTAHPGRRRFATLRAIAALMMREMSTSGGRSASGILWQIAEPAAGIFLLTMVFGVISRTPPLGTNFPIFYATGVVPFMCYSVLSNKMTYAVPFSKQLLAYPAVTAWDAMTARFLTNFVIQLLVAYLVYVGILMFQETRTDPQIMGIALGFAMTGAFAAGLGVLNGFIIMAFHPWERIYNVLTRPLFILSCIIFTFESVPQPYRDYLWWNPLIHCVGQIRKSFYPSYTGDYVSPGYVFFTSLVMLVVGLALFNRYGRDLVTTT